MTVCNVAIIVGSDSDLPVIAAACGILEEFNISYRINIASAHRTPAHVRACVQDAEAQGVRVFIAGAGMAAALPGVVAAETLCPVIGVPMEGKTAGSLDALLSIVQMPPGIPVATVAVGKAGAQNAALLAVAILAVEDAVLRSRLKDYRAAMSGSVMDKDKKLQETGLARYRAENGQK